MIEFPEQIPEIEKREGIWNVIATEKGILSSDVVRRRLARFYQDIENREIQKYYLLSSISLDSLLLQSTKSLMGLRIMHYIGRYPRKFGSRDTFIEELGKFKDPNPPAYTKIAIEVYEKTPFRAAIKAIEVLDYYRALLCLFANAYMESASDEWRPINRVRLGELHSLHDSSGNLSTKTYWFDPNFSETKCFRYSDPEMFRSVVAKWNGAIQRSRYRSIIVKALLRYVRALDEPDSNIAFIKLWSALECLGGNEYVKYGQLVQRVASLYKEVDYNTQVLQHLREDRNDSIHAGNQSDGARTDCFILQQYFHDLLKFLVFNGKWFITIDDAYEFLDLPSDIQELISKKRKIQQALLFRK